MLHVLTEIEKKKISNTYDNQWVWNQLNILPVTVTDASQVASPNLFFAIHEYLPESCCCTSGITTS